MQNKLGAAALTVCPPGKIISVFPFFPLGFTPSFRCCWISAGGLQQVTSETWQSERHPLIAPLETMS